MHEGLVADYTVQLCIAYFVFYLLQSLFRSWFVVIIVVHHVIVALF